MLPVIPSPESSDLWLRRSGRTAVEGEAGASHRSRLSEAGITPRPISSAASAIGLSDGISPLVHVEPAQLRPHLLDRRLQVPPRRRRIVRPHHRGQLRRQGTETRIGPAQQALDQPLDGLDVHRPAPDPGQLDLGEIGLRPQQPGTLLVDVGRLLGVTADAVPGQLLYDEPPERLDSIDRPVLAATARLLLGRETYDHELVELSAGQAEYRAGLLPVGLHQRVSPGAQLPLGKHRAVPTRKGMTVSKYLKLPAPRSSSPVARITARSGGRRSAP